MTKQNTLNKGNNENKDRFAMLLREVEQEIANKGLQSEKMLELSKIIAYSVLNKCIDVSQNNQLRSVKNEITKDTKHLQALENITTTNYSLGYNVDGDVIQIIHDKSMHQAFDKLIQKRLGDGLDLVHDAWIALQCEIEKQQERENGLQVENWLETPYNVRQLKRKVYIKLEDSVKGWEDITITPIQQAFRYVREQINNSRAMSTDARNGYSYLEEYAKDEQSDTETKIYKRLPKYADLGGYACDFNGKETLYSASAQDVEDIEEKIEKLNLTVRQAKILQLRLQGKGYKAIATYLGIRFDNVYSQIKEIRRKAKNNGLQGWEKYLNEKPSKEREHTTHQYTCVHSNGQRLTHYFTDEQLSEYIDFWKKGLICVMCENTVIYRA